jgi:hypothetical protein
MTRTRTPWRGGASPSPLLTAAALSERAGGGIAAAPPPVLRLNATLLLPGGPAERLLRSELAWQLRAAFAAAIEAALVSTAPRLPGGGRFTVFPSATPTRSVMPSGYPFQGAEWGFPTATPSSGARASLRLLLGFAPVGDPLTWTRIEEVETVAVPPGASSAAGAPSWMPAQVARGGALDALLDGGAIRGNLPTLYDRLLAAPATDSLTLPREHFANGDARA